MSKPSSTSKHLLPATANSSSAGYAGAAALDGFPATPYWFQAEWPRPVAAIQWVAYGAPMHLVRKVAPVREVAPVSRLAPAIALWLAALLALVLAPVAKATYPGENGKIYFAACDEKGCGYDIYAINPDGSGLENVTDVVTDGPDLPDNAYDPAVSADGKRMAFTVDSQATAQIWIMNTDGTGALQLTNDEMIDQQPTLSPDGSKIVWNHWPEYTDRDIWVMNSDGSGKQSFYDGAGEDYYPRFTPDGQTIVMESETVTWTSGRFPSLPWFRR
jgi:hypothetical protein